MVLTDRIVEPANASGCSAVANIVAARSNYRIVVVHESLLCGR